MPEKGPPVFLDYDQGALDAAYDQAAYAPNREQLIKRRIRDSELARHRIGEPERVAYGSAEIEHIPRPTQTGAGVHLHPWRRLAERVLEGFRRSGRDVPCRRGALCRSRLRLGADVGGSLIVLADEVRCAVAWVYKNAARFDGDPNRLYIGVQSSGGHLAAVALMTDWQRQFNLPADIIKGGMCISGLYDLTPVRLSARSHYVAFDAATVAALSPLQHLDRLHAPLVVAYGTCETPEFQRQHRELAAAVEASGKLMQHTARRGMIAISICRISRRHCGHPTTVQ